jgi:hypothetical protein
MEGKYIFLESYKVENYSERDWWVFLTNLVRGR